MKTTKKRKEIANKVHFDHDGDKTFKEVLYRSRVLGATSQSLEEMRKYDEEKAASLTQKNLRKVFTLLPKSPPPRVLREIQRERSKPLRLPDPEEQDAATAKLEKKLAKQRALRMAAIEQSELDAAKDNRLHQTSRQQRLPLRCRREVPQTWRGLQANKTCHLWYASRRHRLEKALYSNGLIASDQARNT